MDPPEEISRVALKDGASIAFARWAPAATLTTSEAGCAPGSAARPPPRRGPRGRCLLIMGAYATCRLLHPMAAALRGRGYEVVTFDHRGVGASRRAGDGPPCNQSAEGLARDALAVVDAVWGEGAAVHVYG
jgi:alpha-beta hydrolase superfamily lysophospholipase